MAIKNQRGKENAASLAASIGSFFRGISQHFSMKDSASMGLFAGLVIVMGYSLCVCDSGRWRLFYLLLSISAASYISGFFLGFLFGMPKRKTNAETEYQLNNNLSDIADWFTKIIIGLGLVELRQIPALLQLTAQYVVGTTTDATNRGLAPFTIACILYFIVLGVYCGYSYMRLDFSLQIRDADNRLLNSMDETADILKEKNTAPKNTDGLSKSYIEKYVRALLSYKKEEDYTFRDWLFRGENAYHHDEYLLAVGYLKNALNKSQPGDNESLVEAYDYMGVSYLELQMYKEAKETFSKLIGLFPTYPAMADVYYNMGMAIEYADENLKEAKEYYQKALQLKPDHVKALTANAACLMILEEKEAATALVFADKAIGLDPAFAAAHYTRACALSMLKRQPEMLESLKVAILLDPSLREQARKDAVSEFKNYEADPDFRALVGL